MNNQFVLVEIRLDRCKKPDRYGCEYYDPGGGKVKKEVVMLEAVG